MADVVVGVRVRYGRLAACCAVAFAALALAATLGWLRPFDQQLFRSIYTTAPCDVRQASAMANPLFSGELSLLWCAAGAALLAWRRRRPVLGAWLLGLMLLTVPIELVCKRILDQPSPGTFVATLSRRSCTVAAPATGLATAPQAVQNALPSAAAGREAYVELSTFPSGYACRAAFLGIVLAAGLGASRARLRVPLICAALVVVGSLGAGRVIVAWHWPSDVLAGILLGGVAACLFLALADGFRPHARSAG